MSESTEKTSPEDTTPAPPRPGALALALALCALIGLLGAYRLQPPSVAGQEAPPSEFSGERAIGYLCGLIGAGGTRRVGTAANARARAYLLQTLTELGYEPQVQERLLVSPRYPASGFPRNVLAELPGSDPQAKAIVLVAHYDCVGAGVGAADDGSGVATILEVARALKAGPQPKRSVIFLFTDAEESGLLGVDSFTGVLTEQGGAIYEPHPWFQRVGCAINLEARGSRGPSLMFQTGPKSAPLIAALARSAPRPVLGSSFATVYETLPNNTDLSSFKEKGIPGLNFAFIDGIEHYHTALDDLAHLDPRSVQHHGENVLLLVRELMNAPDLGGDAPDLVYFDVLAAFVVRWPASLSPALAGAALALVLLTLGLLARGGFGGWVAGRFGWGLLVLLGTLVFGVVFGQVAARWLWTPVAWPAEPAPWIVLAAALSLAAACFAAQLAWRAGFWGAWGAIWASQAALALALSLTPLVGFCYLFLVPALVAGVAGVVAGALKPRCSKAAAIAGLLPLGAAALLLGPLLVLLYQAMGLEAFGLPKSANWPALALFPAVTVLAVLPLVPFLCLRGAGRGALLFTAIGFALLAAAVAPTAKHYQVHPLRAADAQAQLPGRRGDVPYRADLIFHQSFEDEGTGDPVQVDAEWLAFPFPRHDPYAATEQDPAGIPRPPWLTSAPRAFDPTPMRPWAGLPLAFRAQATPLSGAEPPQIEDLKVEPHGEGRLVSFRLRSPRKAPMVGLFFLSGAPTSLKIEGKPALRSVRHWCSGTPPEGLRVEAYFSNGTQRQSEVRVVDATLGLPKSGRVLLELRDAVGTATSDGADLHVHSTKTKL